MFNFLWLKVFFFAFVLLMMKNLTVKLMNKSFMTFSRVWFWKGNWEITDDHIIIVLRILIQNTQKKPSSEEYINFKIESMMTNA